MPRRKTSQERSVRWPRRPKRRSAWAAGASGRRSAAGHPKKAVTGRANNSPIQPKLFAPTPPSSWAIPSAASEPPRKTANRSSTIPRISRLSADSCLSLSLWPDFGDLPVLIDRDHRIGVHRRGGGEVVTKSCRFERLPVGRVLEDFRNVVAIFLVNEH